MGIARGNDAHENRLGNARGKTNTRMGNEREETEKKNPQEIRQGILAGNRGIASIDVGSDIKKGMGTPVLKGKVPD